MTRQTRRLTKIKDWRTSSIIHLKGPEVGNRGRVSRRKGAEDKDDENEDEETDDGQTKQTRRTRRTKRSQKKVIEDPFSPHTNVPDIWLGLLNLRSMRNKGNKVLKLIESNSLNVFLTTETWLPGCIARTFLWEASPQNFTSYYWSRDGGGGGVASQFSDILQTRQLQCANTTTFESVVTEVKHDEWDEPMLIVALYRPPRGRFSTFLDQFQMLLDAFNNYSSIIIAGDFNIWVDCNTARTRKFQDVLEKYNFQQQVKSPTHCKNHTLDLFISRNVEVSHLFVRNNTISDHCTVYSRVKLASRGPQGGHEEGEDQDEQPKRFKVREE